MKSALKKLYGGDTEGSPEGSPEGSHFVVTLSKFQFPGPGQHETEVAPLDVLLDIIQAAPGKAALTFRLHCKHLLLRVFAGDQNLHDVIDENRAGMDAQTRRDLLRNVPGAAPVEDDDEASTSAPGVNACDLDANGASMNDRDLVRVPGAADTPDAQGEALTPFCGQTCTEKLNLSQLIPVPGLSSDLPPLDQMKCHGTYLFILGMYVWNGVAVLVPKPGASFFGTDGMHGRYTSALRKYPNLSVMFMEPCAATTARDGESEMEHGLSSLGNAFQIGNTEKWAVTVAPGMHPADAARILSANLHGHLPTPRLDPVPGPVPDEVARAFRDATASMRADTAACGVKGRLWADETGHRYHVEVMRVESELERHRIDKQAHAQIEITKHEARLASLQTSLAQGFITQEQYLVSL